MKKNRLTAALLAAAMMLALVLVPMSIVRAESAESYNGCDATEPAETDPAEPTEPAETDPVEPTEPAETDPPEPEPSEPESTPVPEPTPVPAPAVPATGSYGMTLLGAAAIALGVFGCACVVVVLEQCSYKTDRRSAARKR